MYLKLRRIVEFNTVMVVIAIFGADGANKAAQDSGAEHFRHFGNSILLLLHGLLFDDLRLHFGSEFDRLQSRFLVVAVLAALVQLLLDMLVLFKVLFDKLINLFLAVAVSRLVRGQMHDLLWAEVGQSNGRIVPAQVFRILGLNGHHNLFQFQLLIFAYLEE